MSSGLRPRLHWSNAGARSARLPDAYDMPAAAAAASAALALMEKLACESIKERRAAEPSKEEGTEKWDEVALDSADAFLCAGVSSDGKASAAEAGSFFFLSFCCCCCCCSAAAAALAAALECPVHSVSLDSSRAFSAYRASRVSLTAISATCHEKALMIFF